MHGGIPAAAVTIAGLAAGIGSSAYDSCCNAGEETGALSRAFPAGLSSIKPPAARPARRAAERTFLVLHVKKLVALRSRPRGAIESWLGPTTEFGSPRVVSVARRRGRWLGVVTPTLPNGEVGWIKWGDPAVRARRVRWSLRADLSARRLVLRRGTRPVKRVTVAIGGPASPTPSGRFAVTDKLAGARYSASYGCCILALSGHQDQLPVGWTGGNRLAIHGTYATGTVGLPATAGCLRANNGEMAALMGRVPLGTPVFIGP